MKPHFLAMCCLLFTSSLTYSAEFSFIMPPADDPVEIEKSSYPVNWGFNSPYKVECKRKANPGEKDYCLRPTDDSEIWLRADDNFTRIETIQRWSSPSPPGNTATGDPERKGEHPAYLSEAFGEFPAVRIMHNTSLKLKWPQGFETFTVFLVGRQVEGTEAGPILSSSKRFRHSLHWENGNTIVIDSNQGLPTTFTYEGATDFHLLMLYFDGSDVSAFVNGKYIGSEPLNIESTIAWTYIGNEPGKSSNKKSLKDLIQRGPSQDPLNHASDVLEIIAYPVKLSEEDIKKTLRYLRKKYGLN